MRYGSVCSGIEAASLAWEPLGWQPAWFSEIEPFPAAVLAQRWPDVPNLGDMTAIAERIRNGEVETPDVLVGGTPCQAFSVAGLRRSLDDDRGNLTLKFVEIANAIDEIRAKQGKAHCIIVWENVPGVLNTRDNALGCFFGGLVGAECALEPAGGRWTNSGAVRGERRNLAWRVLDAQFFGVPQRRKRIFVIASAGEYAPWEILFEREGVRRNPTPHGKEGETVADEIRAGSHWDNTENPHPTLNQSNSTSGIGASNQELFSQRGAGLVPVCYGGGNRNEISVSTTLTAHGVRMDFDHETFVVNGRQDPIISDVAQPIGCQNNGMDNVLCINANIINKTERSGGNGLGVDTTNTGYTLTATDRHAVQYGSAVRRLTPVECERLQGMPDNHTRIKWRGKSAEDCPDGPRYKAIGNSMCVNVMRFIGERINEVNKISSYT